MHVKICGVTTVEQALACVECGASAIGVNLVPSSPRRVDAATARRIARAVGGRALVVGVVAGHSADVMQRLRAEAELGCLQLHGDEPATALAPLLPHAYKALRIGSAADVARAADFPGEHLLVDARADGGALGGTGRTFDWALVTELARTRRLTLAGGLTPQNVGDAIRALWPYCVDVSSGVESGTPGVKDMAKVRAFMENARRAAPQRAQT